MLQSRGLGKARAGVCQGDRGVSNHWTGLWTGTGIWNGLSTIFIPGFYYFLGRSFVRALPQCLVVLSHCQGREREEVAAIKVTIDHTA